MNDLTKRLQDVDEAGVFGLNCHVHKLHAIAAEVGMPVLEAGLAAVGGKGEFLAAMAQAIKAPEWFGNNWDALADALGDLSWLGAAPGYVMLLRNGGDMLGLDSGEYATAMGIFSDAAAFWKSQDKPFWVFFC